MRLIVLISLLITTVFATSQGPPPVPAELKELAYMTGTWKGKEKFYGEPGQVIDMEAEISSKLAVGGRFLESSHRSFAGGQTFVEGLELMTYDETDKLWRAYWFDNAGAKPVKFEGKLEGTTLTMTSEPFEMPGVPGKVVLKTVTTKKSDKEMSMVMEIKVGDAWSKFVEGAYTKS